MKPLSNTYDHKSREKHWQDHWQEHDTHAFADDADRDNTYVIDTPPPTVSGVLHMGHIFSYTQADFIARYQRMSGKDVYYPMGFDDNGLPTERLVEKTLKIKGSAMPREEFVAKCREVVVSAENEFRRLFKSTALSVDWKQEYQTISDDVRCLSQASFLDLIQKNEIYRDFRPTFWDWVDQTAIAQAEIENKELPATMNELLFTLEDGSPIHIATTRPELLGACVAVMYHPEDSNAAKYKGKKAVTPLFGVKVPMIADAAVDQEKGTGLVMCCTYGDETDKEWQRTHELPRRTILSTIGRITIELNDKITFLAGVDGKDDHSELSVDNCVDLEKTKAIFLQIENLKPKQAQAKMLDLLQAEKKIIKQDHIVHTVKCAERSGTPIEIIPTYQWFIKVVDKKETLLKKGSEVNWRPEHMKIRLNQWIEGLKEDWCISRQRFFGVPIPVWYSTRTGEEGKILLPSYDQLPIDPMVDLPEGYSKDEVIPDKDILDTWATSSISPQINSKGISEAFALDKKRHAKLFPADLRPQAHEIIRTWAFYTIAKACLHENTIPWNNIMISGWCLASDKTKMSKSKGNVVTPVALIEEKGTDSVRYWASTSRLATDTAFSEDLLKIGRKLVNKLWNASKFASQNLEKLEKTPTTAIADTQSGIIYEALDLWILSRLHKSVKKSKEAFERYEYADARVAIEDFFWNDLCDNYLELVKTRSYNDASNTPENMAQAAKAQQSALTTIYHCLDTVLRLFAPFVPHITEELYSCIFDEKYKKTGSIHARGMWPMAEDYPYNEKTEQAGIACVDILNSIRKTKSEAGVSIKWPVAEVAVNKANEALNWDDIATTFEDLKAAGNAFSITKSDSELATKSEKGWFTLNVILAKQEEHKRNSDHKEGETLDTKNIIHGEGTPNLNKHTVKVQVNDLPNSLERQKG